MMIVNMPSGHISMKYGFKGVNKVVISACATGSHSVGDAFRSIQYDDADIMIAGGAEATICDVGIGAFSAARTLSKRNDEPQRASRPYDKERDGFVMSEGSCVLVLEEYEHAKARGAKIYAEIVGYGQSADAYDVVAPAPDGAGAIKSMELALKDAGMKPEEVQYVNTHGTSTGLGDKAESHAVAKVFGDRKENPELLVTSTKSMHGHMLGATGAAEAIVCIKTINENIVPPTINLDNQDEEVADLNYVPYKAVSADVHAALSNSFGFGGQNASLIFKEVK
jgi:3-oxoacyl-[acyl-carrier-protein] synthase II